MKIAVSVIVPVYNVERYLTQCLDSLVNQTLEAIEIIVVNDGTKDNSQSIIDQFQAQYPSKIRSFFKTNGGLGDARNFGMQKATGEYIGFVDSDDYVEHDMYQKMYDLAQRDNLDLVVCGLEYFYEDSNRIDVKQGLFNAENIDSTKSIFLSPLFAWNKLYRKALIDKFSLEFPVQLWYEDIPFTTPFFALSQRIGVVEETLIHYRQRSTSIMGSRNNDKIHDIILIMKLCHSRFKSLDILETYSKELEYLFIDQLLVHGGFRFLNTFRFRSMYRESIDLLDGYFTDWRANPYLGLIKKRYQIYVRFVQKWMISPMSLLLVVKRHFS